MKHILSTGIFAALAMSYFHNADKGGDVGGGAEEEKPVTFFSSAADFLAAHPIVETVSIEIKKLIVDAGTQPRVALSDDVIKDYAEVITNSEKGEQPNPFDLLPDGNLPQVFRDPTGRCVLADGFHRLGAHKLAKVKEMRVAIRDGVQRDALIFSLSTNQGHGIQRTNKDKDRAVRLALNNEELVNWSNTEIAKLCGVSEFKVRDSRPAAKSPTIRKAVSASGKVTTINTSAIGKGKGGGKKGAAAAAKVAKAAAKASGGTAPAAPAGKAAPSGVTAEQELETHLKKIAAAVGGEAGGAIRTAVHDGSLAISAAEVRAWAGFAPEKIKAVAPLVTGGTRMKPTKAFDFLASELPEKIVTELHNRAIGSPKGVFKYEGDGVEITVKHITKV